LSFSDASHGWAIGSSVIRHTNNGGATWDVQYEKKYDPTNIYGFQSIFFVNDKTGWVCGYQDGDMGCFSGIVRTTDGGGSWKESHAQNPLISIQFMDANIGMAVGMAIPGGYLGNNRGAPRRDGVVMLTTDSGDSWRETYRTNDRRLFDVYVNKSGECWAVGEGGTLLHGAIRRAGSK